MSGNPRPTLCSPPPAGNVLFSGLLAGIGIASALALQRYGSWRRQNPLASEGRIAPVAVATQTADAGLAPADSLAALAAEEGTASDGNAGPAARQAGRHDVPPPRTTAGVVQGQSRDSHDFEWDDAPVPSLDKAQAAAPGGEQVAVGADPQHGSSTEHAAPGPTHDAQGDRDGHQASALLPPATSEAPRQPARKLPIRTQEGAAALERMRRLQQRRQQLYSQLQERQEQRYRQAFGFDEESQAESAQPAAPSQQRQEAGEQQGQAPSAQPDAGHPAEQQGAPADARAAGLEVQQAEAGPGEEDAELHLQDSSVRWLLRELEREEQREAAALAEQAEALASAAGSMSTAAVRQRAATAHRAAATAARHAQRATAAFSTAAEAATAAANSAQRAASAAARAQVAVERRWAVEAEKAAAQAKQAAEDGAAAAQKAAVASARSVMAKHDVHKQAQLAAQGADLSRHANMLRPARWHLRLCLDLAAAQPGRCAGVRVQLGLAWQIEM